MLTRKMRTAVRLAAQKLGRTSRAKQPHALVDETEARIIAMLKALPDGTDYVVLRAIHKSLGIDQPSILRAVRNLDAMEMIKIDEVVHDRLASRVSLAGVVLKEV